MTRRQWLQSAGVAAAACAVDALWLEPDGIRVSHHDLMLDRTSGRHVRLIQVSDLHLRTMDGHAELIAKTINGAGADVVIITGDAIDDAKNVGLLTEFLSGIDRSLQKLAILGNWEYWGSVDIPSLRSGYERHNCDLLVNRAARLQVGGRYVRFVGLDDYVGGRASLGQAENGSRCTSRADSAHP